MPQCKYCGTTYSTLEEAQACESLGLASEPKYREGDRFGKWGMIVVIELKVILKTSRKQPNRHVITYKVRWSTRYTSLTEKALDEKGKYR